MRADGGTAGWGGRGARGLLCVHARGGRRRRLTGPRARRIRNHDTHNKAGKAVWECNKGTHSASIFSALFDEFRRQSAKKDEPKAQQAAQLIKEALIGDIKISKDVRKELSAFKPQPQA